MISFVNILEALGVFLVLGIVAGVVLALTSEKSKEDKKERVKRVDKERLRAFVKCSGGDAAEHRYTYADAPDCRIAAHLYGGLTICRFACLGLGNCKAVCKNGAIEIKGGVAVVNGTLCDGCGKCVSACPRGIIELMAKDATVETACSNPEGVCSFASEFDDISDSVDAY